MRIIYFLGCSKILTENIPEYPILIFSLNTGDRRI